MTDVNGLTKEFLENESYRKYTRSDQIFLNHEILSFSSRDSPKITTGVLKDIMDKYVSLRGSQGVYLGAIHQDTEHIHLHIAVSGLAYRTGRSFYLPKNKLNELKRELQDYQIEKYPELKYSLPKHGTNKEYLTDREWRASEKEGRKFTKEKISTILLSAFENAKTQNEFLSILTKQNLHYYERNGVATGIILDETKFRFTRLGIEIEKLKSLPVDMKEERRVLNEIQALRQSRNEKSNNKPFNEIER
jgi:hypothetical protein